MFAHDLLPSFNCLIDAINKIPLPFPIFCTAAFWLYALPFKGRGVDPPCKIWISYEKKNMKRMKYKAFCGGKKADFAVCFKNAVIVPVVYVCKIILKWNKIYTSSNTTILYFIKFKFKLIKYKIVVFDEVYISFHFNIILNKTGYSPLKLYKISHFWGVLGYARPTYRTTVS